MDRRQFLQNMSALAATLSVTPVPSAFGATDDKHPQRITTPITEDKWGKLLPLRKLGNTGEFITALGLGGHHVGAPDEKTAHKICDNAIEQGIRFIDTAHAYQGGRSETRIGKYLIPKYRDQLYIMSKTRANTAAQVRQHLDASKKRLGIDTLDCYHIHTIENPNDVDYRVDHGVVDELFKARDAGEIRHLGFSCHKRTSAPLRLLERLTQLGVELDVCQLALNVCDPHHDSFAYRVVPDVIKRGYGVFAMKTLANGQFFGRVDGWARRGRKTPGQVVPERMTLDQALHFVWSLPVATLISGMDKPEQVITNADICRTYAEMTDDDRDKLIDAVADISGTDMEFYKSLPD